MISNSWRYSSLVDEANQHIVVHWINEQEHFVVTTPASKPRRLNERCACKKSPLEGPSVDGILP